MGISRDAALADGTTLIRVFCELNQESTKDRRDVRFSISTGQFTDTKDTVKIAKAIFQNDKLIAEAFFLVPFSGERIIVAARPNLPDIVHPNLVRYDTVTLSKSVPETLELKASASAIGSNFEDEVALTARLRNADKGNVSSGYKVVFEDSYKDGSDFNGVFRQTIDQIPNGGLASTNYAIGAAVIGTELKITCYLLDENGNKTDIKDFITLFINK
jgi:hypothetical protein